MNEDGVMPQNIVICDIITFLVSRRRCKMYCTHVHLCVCVCLSVYVSVHIRMSTLLHEPGCNLGEW